MKIVFFAAMLLSVMAIAGYAAGLRWNVTSSLPRGLYRLSDEKPQRGDMVSFCLSGSWAELAASRGYVSGGACQYGIKPLLKMVAALPGDRLEVLKQGIKVQSNCSSFWFAPAMSHDFQNLPLPASQLSSGMVPQGKALVMGTHPGSFDSRYFGLVPLDSLIKAEPIFTF